MKNILRTIKRRAVTIRGQHILKISSMNRKENTRGKYNIQKRTKIFSVELEHTEIKVLPW